MVCRLQVAPCQCLRTPRCPKRACTCCTAQQPGWGMPSISESAWLLSVSLGRRCPCSRGSMPAPASIRRFGNSTPTANSCPSSQSCSRAYRPQPFLACSVRYVFLPSRFYFCVCGALLPVSLATSPLMCLLGNSTGRYLPLLRLLWGEKDPLLTEVHAMVLASVGREVEAAPSAAEWREIEEACRARGDDGMLYRGSRVRLCGVAQPGFTGKEGFLSGYQDMAGFYEVTLGHASPLYLQATTSICLGGDALLDEARVTPTAAPPLLALPRPPPLRRLPVRLSPPLAVPVRRWHLRAVK